jgi:hypothetical protein
MKKQVNGFIALVVITFVIIVLLIVKCADAQEIKVGYIISIDNDIKNESTFLKTRSDSLVNEILNFNLRTTDFDVKNHLNSSPFFDCKIDGKYLYVEIRKIKKGKFRKFSKKQFKSLKLFDVYHANN